MNTKARLIWCTWPDCLAGYASLGERPRVCPVCDRPTHWSHARGPAFHQVMGFTEWIDRFLGRDPKVAYELTPSDRLFLKSLRIHADPVDSHLGATE